MSITLASDAVEGWTESCWVKVKENGVHVFYLKLEFQNETLSHALKSQTFEI